MRIVYGMEREGKVGPDKPLNVRCAVALGAKLFRAGKRRPATVIGCRVTYGTWLVIEPRAAECGPVVADVPPYGEETPAGWACTGPLIGRFGLRMGNEPGETSWFALSETLIGPDAIGPCAAIAEWVAEFGAEALRKEPRA